MRALGEGLVAVTGGDLELEDREVDLRQQRTRWETLAIGPEGGQRAARIAELAPQQTPEPVQRELGVSRVALRRERERAGGAAEVALPFERQRARVGTLAGRGRERGHHG